MIFIYTNPNRPPNRAKLDQRSSDMNSGLLELAPDGVFGGLSQPQYQTRYDAVGELRLQLKRAEQMLRNLRDDLASAELSLWDATGVISRGVAGDAAYGPNSALYGSFGLIRASQRKSGLTRKGDLDKAKAKTDASLAGLVLKDAAPAAMAAMPLAAFELNGVNGKH